MERLKISYLDINKIKPYENNAKIHTDEQIEQIKRSIDAFGFNDPIAVDENGMIVEGHGRYTAAKELNFEKIPAIILNDLTEEQKRAYILIHNKLTMNTGFDLEILNAELKRIDFDMGQFGLEELFTNLSDLNDVTEGYDKFSLTLTFPKGEESLLKNFFKVKGKDYVAENIILEVMKNATMREPVHNM